MNPVDLAVGFTLGIFALRGYWRGFFRESFGVLALLGGLAAAMRLSPGLSQRLEPYAALPVVREGTAFVGTFVATYCVTTLIGYALHRLAGGAAYGLANRLAGVAVGAGKGGALLAFVLLFLHLFPLIGTLDTRLMESHLAPPLIAAASNVIRFGVGSDSADAATRS